MGGSVTRMLGGWGVVWYSLLEVLGAVSRQMNGSIQRDQREAVLSAAIGAGVVGRSRDEVLHHLRRDAKMQGGSCQSLYCTIALRCQSLKMMLLQCTCVLHPVPYERPLGFPVINIKKSQAIHLRPDS